ncbi:MAG: fibronectin type III-like domain-contianing protein [Bryobacteraceae bacterium]
MRASSGLAFLTPPFRLRNANVVNNLGAANPNFQVNVDVTNTGAVAGAEVAEVYLGLPASTNEPPKRLVGWQKILLQPGQKQMATVQVNQNDSSHPMSYWDVNSLSWLTANGDYAVYVGSSSSLRDLTVAGTIHVGP